MKYFKNHDILTLNTIPSIFQNITAASLGVSAKTANNKPAEPSKREKLEVLHLLLPGVEWEENGKSYRQRVSSIPAKDEEVKRLDETLQNRLRERHARETEVCPIRRELFTQCFGNITVLQNAFGFRRST